jgi:hypothetical protein
MRNRVLVADRQTAAIIVLSLSAVLLALVLVLTPPVAVAEATIRDRDYSVVTAAATTGGDALYIADNRSGMMAVFTFDKQTRSIRTRAVRPLSDAFDTDVAEDRR